jgi:acetolactate synthase I/II/III large subunit
VTTHAQPGTAARIAPAATPLLTETVSVPEGIVAALEDAGIDLVLGVIAGHTTPIFEHFYDRPSIRTIQVRQEIVAALAANAYGRMTGRPAVIMGEGEFILGTATQGIIESLLGSTPMVIITEMFDGGRMSHHGNYHSGAGEPGTYDAIAAYRAICKRVFVSHHPAQAVQQAQLAVKHAVSGEPGPVAVIMRSSAFEGTVGPESFPRLYRAAGYLKETSRGVDPTTAAAAVEALRAAERPVILAGNGVRLSGAYDALRHLAELTEAPVATTQGGKSAIDEADPIAAGVFGEWGRESANALVAGADLLLAVGTKLGPIDTVDQVPTLIDPTRQVLIQIDAEPLNAAWTFPVDVVATGDAGAVLERLAADLGDTPGARPVSARDRVAAAIAEHDRPLAAAHTTDTVPLRPERLVRILQEEWPENGIVTTDAGESRVYMLNWFKARRPGSYLVPHGGGGMGYATSAAFGAKLVHPDRPVIACCGDGGFAMTMNTLMNAVQEQVPISVLIFNNGALGWPLHVMPADKKRHFEFHDFDHAAIARAMGCRGRRVTTADEVREALVEARTSDLPYVIDARIDVEADFLDATASIAKAPRERPWLAAAE